MPRKTNKPTAKSTASKPPKKVPAFFFRTRQGNEPVRDWLKGDLAPDERKSVGEDIKTVEYGWPIGMPTCRSLGGGLHEVRTSLSNRTARVLFYVDKRRRMVLLHGIIKKSQQTPDADLELARNRMAAHKEGMDDEQS